ncbi:MAG: hypothetical protein JO165_02635 [Candidatus Eremiobacteraeota bacterium]|nr:hypothetical protein [Candidatus Eremiobacteraeota bacterium]
MIRNLAAVERNLAQESFIDFCKITTPWFETPAHIKYFADLLERVERGEIKRLALNAPPGHGKSSAHAALRCMVHWSRSKAARLYPQRNGKIGSPQ